MNQNSDLKFSLVQKLSVDLGQEQVIVNYYLLGVSNV
jgi:hypothetical protein